MAIWGDRGEPPSSQAGRLGARFVPALLLRSFPRGLPRSQAQAQALKLPKSSLKRSAVLAPLCSRFIRFGPEPNHLFAYGVSFPVLLLARPGIPESCNAWQESIVFYQMLRTLALSPLLSFVVMRIYSSMVHWQLFKIEGLVSPKG